MLIIFLSVLSKLVYLITVTAFDILRNAYILRGQIKDVEEQLRRQLIDIRDELKEDLRKVKSDILHIR